MNWFKIGQKLKNKSNPGNYNKEQLKNGIKIEKEHTGNIETAQQIAMDHLDEFPDYYKELDKMEKKLENNELV